MATSNEQSKRAAGWQAMLVYARWIAGVHIGRKQRPEPTDDEEPTRITRNIGPVHKRKFKKAVAA